MGSREWGYKENEGDENEVGGKGSREFIRPEVSRKVNVRLT